MQIPFLQNSLNFFLKFLLNINLRIQDNLNCEKFLANTMYNLVKLTPIVILSTSEPQRHANYILLCIIFLNLLHHPLCNKPRKKIMIVSLED